LKPPSRKKQVATHTLSCGDTNNPKIQEEEALAPPSASEHCIITFPMHDAMIFKDRNKSKDTMKGLSQCHYSIHNIEAYNLLEYTSLNHEERNYCLGTMNTYFIQDRLTLKRL
jgi:hypothetical protein